MNPNLFLTQETIKPVFEVVKRAVQQERPKKEITRIEAKAEKAAVSLLRIAGVGFAVLICLAAIFYFWPSRIIANITLGIAIVVELLSVLSLLAIILSQIPFMNRVRSDPTAPILELVQGELDILMPDVNALMASPIPALIYVRHHVFYQRDCFDNRRARLMGKLEKIGFFPAMATLGISAAKLIQDHHLVLQDSTVWLVAGLLAAFYLSNLVLADTSDKLALAIKMLDYAIEHHPESGKNKKPLFRNARLRTGFGIKRLNP